MGENTDVGWLPSFQGVYDSVVATVLFDLFLLLGGIVLAWWARVKNHLSLPFVVLIVMGFIALSLIVVNQLKALFESRPSPAAVVPLPITTETPNEEIADRIRQWLDRFHLQVQKEDQGGAHFSFVVRGADGVPVTIMRLGKEREQFITFLSRVFISTEDQVRLKALSDQQRERFYREVTLELARQKTSAAVEISQITIETRIPLAELTEARLLDRLDEVNYAVKMVIVKIRLLLDPQT